MTAVQTQPQAPHSQLLATWFRNPPNPGAADEPLWVIVKNTFAVGKTRAHELCREFAQDPDRIIPGLVLDGWCRTCHVLYCDRCEELTYVPDGQGPECEHCGDDLDDDAKEVLQHAQSGTASPSEVERRLRVSLARLANPVVQPIIGPHAFNMINPSQIITISADNPSHPQTR